MTLNLTLRQFRTEQARLRQVPPYVIFSDRVLNAILDERPSSRETFLAIKGLGPSKWAHFGQQILEMIAHESDL
jgi:superfamily II DNA helicase RecQ